MDDALDPDGPDAAVAGRPPAPSGVQGDERVATLRRPDVLVALIGLVAVLLLALLVLG